MDPRVPEVERQHEHPPAGFGHDHGEVGHRRGLALLGAGTGDEYHLGCLAAPADSAGRT